MITKNIEHMTTKERLAYISYLKRTGSHNEAFKFWLQRVNGISKKRFMEA